MPTITIHDDDADFIASIVSLIMRADQVPARIVIDNGDLPDWDADELAGDPTPEPTEPESWFHEAARIDAEAAATQVATTHPLVVTIGEQERQRTIDTRIVGCPKCKARPGKTCNSPLGESYGNTFVHNARRVAYNQSRRVTLDEM